MQMHVAKHAFYIFRQQGTLQYFEDVLHNVCSIFHKMAFISYFSPFLFNPYFFHKPCTKI